MDWIWNIREAHKLLNEDFVGAVRLVADALDESRSRDLRKQADIHKRYGHLYKGMSGRSKSAGAEAWREGEHAFVLHGKSAPEETKMKAHGAAAAAHGLAADAISKFASEHEKTHGKSHDLAKQTAKLHRAAEAHHNEKADDLMAGHTRPYAVGEAVEYLACLEAKGVIRSRLMRAKVRTVPVLGGKQNTRGLFRTGLKGKKK